MIPFLIIFLSIIDQAYLICDPNLQSRMNTTINNFCTETRDGYCHINGYNNEKDQTITNIADFYLCYDQIDSYIIINKSNIYFNQTSNLSNIFNLTASSIIMIDSQLQVNSLNLISGQNIQINSSHIDTSNFNLISGQNIQINSSHINTSNFNLISGQNIQINSSHINTFNLYIHTQGLYLNKSQITQITSNISRCNMNESSLEKEFYKQELDKLKYNYSIICNNLELSDQSKLLSSHIAIQGRTMDINDSKILTDGLGCNSQQGLGRGYLNSVVTTKWECGGTGGSYGGQGNYGYSLNEDNNPACSQILSRGLYGNKYYPIYEGSGGGGKSDDQGEGGSGGGVIYIQMKDKLINNGEISSNGQIPTIQARQTYGSGSGGSIIIQCHHLEGKGNITAQGGDSKNLGGYGGGGRISLFLLAYLEDQPNLPLPLSQIKFSVDGGTQNNEKGDTSNHTKPQKRGSIISTHCPPGNEQDTNFNCVRCPLGKYKSEYGSSSCLDCTHQPHNSKFTESIQTNFSCSYECLPGYQRYEINSQSVFICISRTDKIYRQIGEENGLIAIISLLVIFLIVVFYWIISLTITKRSRRRTKRHNIRNLVQNVTNSNQNEISILPQFLMEDLPYHVQRIYILGQNTYRFPWNIQKDSDHDELINQEEFTNMTNEFNQIAKYTLLQSTIIITFKIIYFPFYYLIEKYLKRKKFDKLLDLVQTQKESLFRENGYTVKFSCSIDHTLCYFDFVNYNQNILNWQNQTTFPLSLVLAGHGTFIYPFHLNLSDPQCKSLFFSLTKEAVAYHSDNEEAGLSGEENIQQFEIFGGEFNLTAKTIDFSSHQKQFTTQFIKLIEVVINANQAFFNKLNIEVQLCLHFFTLLNSKMNSAIILNYKNQIQNEITLQNAHTLKNYCEFQEIKVSLHFVQKDNEFKTEIEDQIINNQNVYFQSSNLHADEMEILRKKMYQKQIDEEQQNVYKYTILHQNQNIIQTENNYETRLSQIKEENVGLRFFLYCIQRFFQQFKSQIMVYRVNKIKIYILIALIFFCLVLQYTLIFMTFGSFFFLETYNTFELIFYLSVFPLSSEIASILNLLWVIFILQINQRCSKITRISERFT